MQRDFYVSSSPEAGHDGVPSDAPYEVSGEGMA
jgi:hypothetical protein